MTKQISLGDGKFALVDDEDFERVNQRQWTLANGGRYARATIRKDGLLALILMHRFILDTPPGMDTDHINGDGLDNRKSNLRIATHVQNMRNRASHARKFKGVHYRKERGVYHAYIKFEHKRKNLGHFVDETAAACAYDYAALTHFGEFARLNFPDGCPLTVAEVDALKFQRKKSSRFQGVSWSKGKWKATIMVGYKTIRLGLFVNEKDAAMAYNEACVKYHGDKAKPNKFMT